MRTCAPRAFQGSRKRFRSTPAGDVSVVAHSHRVAAQLGEMLGERQAPCSADPEKPKAPAPCDVARQVRLRYQADRDERNDALSRCHTMTRESGQHSALARMTTSVACHDWISGGRSRCRSLRGELDIRRRTDALIARSRGLWPFRESAEQGACRSPSIHPAEPPLVRWATTLTSAGRRGAEALAASPEARGAHVRIVDLGLPMARTSPTGSSRRTLGGSLRAPSPDKPPDWAVVVSTTAPIVSGRRPSSGDSADSLALSHVGRSAHLKKYRMALGPGAAWGKVSILEVTRASGSQPLRSTLLPEPTAGRADAALGAAHERSVALIISAEDRARTPSSRAS